MAHTTQSRPDSGLGFQVEVLRTFQVVPSSLGSRPDFGGWSVHLGCSADRTPATRAFM